MDVEKVHSTLKAIVRDWSDVCTEERKMSYGPILQRLGRVFQDKKREDVKV
jgi:N2227-like protein